MKTDTKAICAMCRNDFFLKEHLTGLILNDEHFICKDCCKSQAIYSFIEQKSEDRKVLRPIHRYMLENRIDY